MKKNLPKLVFLVAVLLTMSSVFASCQRESAVRLFFEGRNAYTEDNYEEAFYFLNKAIKIDPKYSEAYYVRGQTYYIMKNYEEAIADYTRCIDCDPTHAEAYYWRGEAYYHQEDLKNAISDMTMAIELNPDCSDYYYMRGSYYYLSDEYYDFDKAINDYKKGCELGDKVLCERLKRLLDE